MYSVSFRLGFANVNDEVAKVEICTHNGASLSDFNVELARCLGSL